MLLLELVAVLVAQLEQCVSLLYGASRGLAHRGQEEPVPPGPVTLDTDRLKEFVVLALVLLDIAGQVQQWLAEPLTLYQKERDEQTSNAAVPV